MIARLARALPPRAQWPAMAVGFALLGAMAWLVAWPEAWS